ncbi:hypothetical protein ACETIH_08055 [Microvirga arabica]|uniref:DUF3072 domain-containing protein n=1 Tax=Microvirga arabica TaxID=1128671 RepID=A0ABV6Y644_9HYPH
MPVDSRGEQPASRQLVSKEEATVAHENYMKGVEEEIAQLQAKRKERRESLWIAR